MASAGSAIGIEAVAAPAARPIARRPHVLDWLRQPGVLTAVPMTVLLLAGFVGPLLLVTIFAFMPAQSFSVLQTPTLANFEEILATSYYISFLSSVWLAALTVLILFVICYPVAYAMVRVFGHRGSILAVLITAPLFVAENLRLLGWVLFLVKGGVVSGSLETFLGIQVDSMLYTSAATLFGLVYVYLPFMLFPMTLGISMVPMQMREAAFDLGASRWQVLKEVDIPLAMPGILIGALMTFILAAGAISEAKILGGTAVVMIAQDIQKEFTFAQNWPKGSALSVLMILLAGGLALTLLKRIDLDGIFGRR